MSVEGVRYADDGERFRLESRIATGGMGEVWRATDTILGRTVAVKLLKQEYADDAMFRSRFASEAQHAAALHHPGVAAVYDFGEGTSGPDGPRPYLVMELVDGQPLSALIRPGQPLDPEATRDLMAQAADAIGAAHAAGIIHRDVKPANLLVTPDRRVKITDFGIARATEGMALTQTGQVMGTPQYLSPEQAQGGRATPASDVYSLGVVTFECLTGRRPFTGESPVATALAQIREPVPPLPASVPRDLAAVVTRAMSKEPSERFADGTAYAAALREPATVAAAVAPPVVPSTTATQVMPAAATGPGTLATPVPPPGSGRRRGGGLWLWALLALLVAAAVVALIWVASQGDDPGQQTDEPRQPRPSAEESPSETVEESPSETPEETPTETEAETFDIDESDYVGRDVKDVESELKALGLKVQKEKLENDGTHEEDTVESVDPTSDLQEGDTVVVQHWDKTAPGLEEPGAGETEGDTP